MSQLNICLCVIVGSEQKRRKKNICEDNHYCNSVNLSCVCGSYTMSYISQYMKPESTSPLACESVNSGSRTFPKSRQRDNFNSKDIWSATERWSGSYVITDTNLDLIISKVFEITPKKCELIPRFHHPCGQVPTPVSALALFALLLLFKQSGGCIKNPF